uniref:Uncharacterized protein n=1 Tax=Cacopsylla melanoneura TaxID=428564 RepID=A0A8D8VEJ7_9HEMI
MMLKTRPLHSLLQDPTTNMSCMWASPSQGTLQKTFGPVLQLVPWSQTECFEFYSTTINWVPVCLLTSTTKHCSLSTMCTGLQVRDSRTSSRRSARHIGCHPHTFPSSFVSVIMIQSITVTQRSPSHVIVKMESNTTLCRQDL